MSDQTTQATLFGRIGNMFRRNRLETRQLGAEVPVPPESIADADAPTGLANLAATAEQTSIVEERTTFLRPWVKRDQAIEQMQSGVNALTDLMGTVRESLERDSDRQDELLNYLSKLPQAIESLPETARVQGEMLRAMQISMDQQNSQQNKLAEVLERMHQAETEQRETLLSVRERVDTISLHEEAIGNSLASVGEALQTVSSTSQASAAVLESLRENLGSRDNQLEGVIRRQNVRFTTMLTVAIVLSMAALTAVVVFGYLGYEALSHMAK